MQFNQSCEADFPREVGEYTVRAEPCTPASVLVALINPADSRLLTDRYTRGRRTFITDAKDSSASSSFERANPCLGFSQISARTTWSSTEGVYSLTVTILTKICSCAFAIPIFIGAVATPVRAEHVEAKKTTITVSAAASLVNVFAEIGKQFEIANPSAKVRFNFASSSSLVSQIQSGAPTDVFAAADLTSFDKLLTSGNVVKSPQVFARNSMQLVVKPGNRLGISSVADMNTASIISLCAKTAPCGAYAAAVLARYGVVIPESKITRGIDATATLNAVSTGDADAAIVYATDALAAKKSVATISIPVGKNVRAMYGIGVVRGSKNSKLAESFISFVLSPAGQKILKSFGFLAP
jgi:molybdate transport system substrate-binding protein